MGSTKSPAQQARRGQAQLGSPSVARGPERGQGPAPITAGRAGQLQDRAGIYFHE